MTPATRQSGRFFDQNRDPAFDGVGSQRLYLDAPGLQRLPRPHRLIRPCPRPVRVHRDTFEFNQSRFAGNFNRIGNGV